MYRPKPDRIPYKDVEGKSITSGKKIFDSRTDSLESINFTNQLSDVTQYYQVQKNKSIITMPKIAHITCYELCFFGN